MSPVTEGGLEDGSQHPLWVWDDPISLVHQPVRQSQGYCPDSRLPGDTVPLSQWDRGNYSSVKGHDTVQLHCSRFITRVKHSETMVRHRLLWRVQQGHLVQAPHNLHRTKQHVIKHERWLRQFLLIMCWTRSCVPKGERSVLPSHWDKPGDTGICTESGNPWSNRVFINLSIKVTWKLRKDYTPQDPAVILLRLAHMEALVNIYQPDTPPSFNKLSSSVRAELSDVDRDTSLIHLFDCLQLLYYDFIINTF